MVDIRVLYQYYLQHRSISTDTRSIAPGGLFFALRGENFDANAFAQQALDKGAAYVVVDNPAYQLNAQCLLVEDSLSALQQLAAHHRSSLTIPVIGLTGSNGKTTTKELINAVLSERYKTFATKGNLNNHIGVPLSILSIAKDTEIAVIEMGANHQKEIEFLCEIARPTHGLITNIGMAHLDGFGGFEGVKKGKAELYGFLRAQHGFAFIYRNNPYLLEMSAAAGLNKIVYYGTQEDNQVSAKLLQADPYIELSWENKSGVFETKANLTGAYNFENILAAICIGDFFEVSAAQIHKGLVNYYPTNNRSQLTKTDNNTVICDFYNANPSSMAAALGNLTALTSAHKVAILGDMFELGPESAAQHRHIVQVAQEASADLLIFIGRHFYAEREHAKGQFFETVAQAEDYLKQVALTNSTVLLKGSRGMALEQLMPLL
jgi:UDP-N-acetylmuramoyl-tripeptide--D-alanyl-D-alanine ligase